MDAVTEPKRWRGDERPRGRGRRVSVDASYVGGWACIAGVLEARDARVLFIDVVKARGSGDAERMALQKAMVIASDAKWRQVVFLHDSDNVDAPAKFADQDWSWTLQRVPRTANVAAHTVAKEGLKLWQAGRDERGTM